MGKPAPPAAGALAMGKLAPLAACALLACALLSCGSKGKPGRPPPGLTIASGASPLDPSCAQNPPFTGSAVEPFVAIDPRDPRHLVGVWQQDRYSDGGANGLVAGITFDGGATWAQTAAQFSACSGGSYERASDPWVSIAPDGTVHQVALAFNRSRPGQAILASRSLDGGRTWLDPIALQRTTDPDLGTDKESVTADPHDARYVYVVWDRLTGQTNPNSAFNTGPAWFARSSDGGATWEAAKVIYDPGADAQTIGNQIVVLPDGALVNVLAVITANSTQAPRTAIAAMRSTDRGATWSAVTVAEALFVGVFDGKTQKAVRSGDVLPTVAVDASSGALFVLWEDARFSNGARDGIALSKSTDGGLKWSAPAQVNLSPAAQAFTPAVNVSSAGKLGVTYYDLRNDDPNDLDHLLATPWLATSTDGGLTFQEVALAPPFNLRTAPFAQGYFIGDYQGLVHAGESFLPFFSMTNAGDGGRAEVFFKPAQPPAAVNVAANAAALARGDAAPAQGDAAAAREDAASARQSPAAAWDARGAVRSVPRTAW